MYGIHSCCLKEDTHNWFVMNDIDYQIGYITDNQYISGEIPETINASMKYHDFIYIHDDDYDIFVLKWL